MNAINHLESAKRLIVSAMESNGTTTQYQRHTLEAALRHIRSAEAEIRAVDAAVASHGRDYVKGGK